MEQTPKRRRIDRAINPSLKLDSLQLSETMKASDSAVSMTPSNKEKKPTKPQFVPAKDDSKPVLQDPILRSDPIETEEAVLRLPPFSLYPDHQERA